MKDMHTAGEIHSRACRPQCRKMTGRCVDQLPLMETSDSSRPSWLWPSDVTRTRSLELDSRCSSFINWSGTPTRKARQSSFSPSPLQISLQFFLQTRSSLSTIDVRTAGTGLIWLYWDWSNGIALFFYRALLRHVLIVRAPISVLFRGMHSS